MIRTVRLLTRLLPNMLRMVWKAATLPSEEITASNHAEWQRMVSKIQLTRDLVAEVGDDELLCAAREALDAAAGALNEWGAANLAPAIA